MLPSSPAPAAGSPLASAALCLLCSVEWRSRSWLEALFALSAGSPAPLSFPVRVLARLEFACACLPGGSCPADFRPAARSALALVLAS